jgi:hypothetical protein
VTDPTPPAACGSSLTAALTAALTEYGLTAALAEQISATVTDHLAAVGAAVYAPNPTAGQPLSLPAVAEYLHGIADHTDLANLADISDDLRTVAATVNHRARVARPFRGDMLAYDELTPALVAWRALIGVLATTGTRCSIPADLMPKGWEMQVIAGWTLRPDIVPDPAEPDHVIITVDHQPLPPGSGPTPGCTGANDPRLNVWCRGPAAYLVHYLDADGNTTGLFGPMCGAHASAKQRRARQLKINTTIQDLPT